MTVSTNSNVVLVVEDDEATRSALSELVELDRFVVARASNGAEALEYLRTSSQPPRLIVLDLTLPKLDGYQFLAEQKKDSAFSRIPTIVTTGRSPAEANKIDVEAIFYKPVDVRLFLDVISHYH